MFTFKQFAIQQDRAAMKVCTDACVLGAFADVGQPKNTLPTRILDIGTGTGLLALMAAQRNPTARIDAIDLDETAVEQALANVANSPFASRVWVAHSRVQAWELPAPGLGYDRILTNPPFYTNHLRPPNPATARALHTDDLPTSDLITAVRRLLNPDGQWWVLLPPYQTDQLVILARAADLYPFRQLLLVPRADKPVFRIVTGFSANGTRVTITNVARETLVIRESDNLTYTPAYQALLRNFYLLF